jgi:hypothetical protein
MYKLLVGRSLFGMKDIKKYVDKDCDLQRQRNRILEVYQ